MADQRRSRDRGGARGPGRRPGTGRSGSGRSGSTRSGSARGAARPTPAARSARPARDLGGRDGGKVAGGSRGPRATGAQDAVAAARRPRFTGRAAVLVMVLAVLAVSYASSLRAYLDQRSEIDALREEIATSTADIDDLEREKERWQDPAYVAAQARERFGYVRPGETPFVVLDEDGQPLDPDATLTDPSTVGTPSEPTAWYEEVWGSVGVAGHPPTRAPAPPATEIDGSDEPTGE